MYKLNKNIDAAGGLTNGVLYKKKSRQYRDS
jgi:hypothetical protein